MIIEVYHVSEQNLRISLEILKKGEEYGLFFVKGEDIKNDTKPLIFISSILEEIDSYCPFKIENGLDKIAKSFLGYQGNNIPSIMKNRIFETEKAYYYTVFFKKPKNIYDIEDVDINIFFKILSEIKTEKIKIHSNFIIIYHF